jgi:hypothetical protein
VTVGAPGRTLPPPLLLPVALGLFLVVACTNVSQAFPKVGPASPYLQSLAALTLVAAWGMATGRVRPVWSPVLTAAVVFLGTRAVSVAVAADPATARGTVLEEAKDLLVLVVVTVVLAALPRWRVVLATVVLALAALAGLSLIQELLGNATTFHGLSNVPLPSELPGLTARHSGPEADVNFWARTLVLFVPFALSLGVRRRLAGRVGWFAVAAVLAGGVYLTQSRGGLLALTAAVVVWSVLWVRSLAKVGLAVAGLAVVAIVLVPGVATRLASLGTLGSTDPTADQSLVDRVAVQRIGWAIARDAPLFGVGAGNFELAEPDYRRRLAPELSQVIAPHNVYLEMLAEGGALGLAGWLLLYGTAVFVAARAVALLRVVDGRAPPSVATLTGLATVSALIGWAVASLVLHLADFPILLVVMACAGVLDVRARALAALALRTGAKVAQPHRPSPRRRRLVGVAATASVVLVLGAVAFLPHPRSTLWVSSRMVQVQPRDLASDAYVYDVISRTSVVATYAALFRDPGLLAAARAEAGVAARHRTTVTVTQARGSAALRLTVTSLDEVSAARVVPALVDIVSRRVSAVSPLYVIRPVS